MPQPGAHCACKHAHVHTHTLHGCRDTHTHPALGPANSSYPWESPDLLPSPAWLPGPSGPPAPSQDMPPIPAPPPDTHTQQVHTQSHQGQGSGLNAFNGPDTWIGLTPRPHPRRCQCSNQTRRLRRCLREEGAPGVPDGTALGHMQASAHRTMGRRPQKQGPLTLSHCFIH